jgi:hypothetical protein
VSSSCTRSLHFSREQGMVGAVSLSLGSWAQSVHTTTQVGLADEGDAREEMRRELDSGCF